MYTTDENPNPPVGFKYSDVLKNGKPVHEKYDSFSLKHPPMDLGRRAKIFSPFDALKGFNDAVASKNIIYEEKHTLTEEETNFLSDSLSKLHALTKNAKATGKSAVRISVTYFEPCTDPFNEAYMTKGQYITITGLVYKIDSEISNTLRVDDKYIDFHKILSIRII